MSSGQEGVACPGRLDHRHLHFKRRRGSRRCRQALRLPAVPTPGPQAPCGQLPLPGDLGQAGRRTVPPPRPTVPTAARVRASPRPRADSAYSQLYFGPKPPAGAHRGSGQDGPRPPDGASKTLGSAADGSSFGRRIWEQTFGLVPTRTPATDGAGEARPGPVAGRGGAGVHPLPHGEATPTSERENTPASGWVGRGLRARPSRRSSSRLSVHPSIRPSPGLCCARPLQVRGGARRAGVVLRLARLPLAPAWGRGAGTGRCRDHDAPPGPRSVGLQSWPFLCVTPPTVCVSCCPGSGGRAHRATGVTGQAGPSGALLQ